MNINAPPNPSTKETLAAFAQTMRIPSLAAEQKFLPDKAI